MNSGQKGIMMPRDLFRKAIGEINRSEEKREERRNLLRGARASLFYVLVENKEFAEATKEYHELCAETPDWGGPQFPPGCKPLEVLGHSCVGVTYKIEDGEGQHAALTILHRNLAQNRQDLINFVEKTHTVDTERITQVKMADSFGGRSYLITAYVAGKPLRAYLDDLVQEPAPRTRAFRDL